MEVKKPAAKKPAKKAPQSVMVEAAQKVIQGNGASLCSWVQWNVGDSNPKLHRGDICYASFYNYGGIKEARITVRPRDLALCDKESAMTFWKWLINDSFWAKCFVTKSVANGLKNGFRMDMKQPFLLIHGAAIAIRMCWEKKTNMKTWNFLVSKGVDPHVAHAFTHVFSHARDNQFSLNVLHGHALFKGDILDPIKYKNQAPNPTQALKLKACKDAGNSSGNFILFSENPKKNPYDYKSKFYLWCSKLPTAREGFGNYNKFDDVLIERIKKEEWNEKA